MRKNDRYIERGMRIKKGDACCERKRGGGE
jgi:hypothetical protein